MLCWRDPPMPRTAFARSQIRPQSELARPAVACAQKGPNLGKRVVRVASRRSAQLPSLTTCVGGFLARARARSLGAHAARASKLDDQRRFKTKLRIQSRSSRSRQRLGALAPRGSARPALLDTLLDRRIR